jgi:nucleolar protein 58
MMNFSVSLKEFRKFEDTADALAAATALNEGKMSDNLKKFLKSAVKGDKLAVADLKLASNIHSKLDIECVSDSKVVSEVMRCIRLQLSDLLSSNLPQKDMNAMRLGLSHSLSRYKLKFSPDKVDTMIVQAVCTSTRQRSFLVIFFFWLADLINPSCQKRRSTKMIEDFIS